MHSTSMGLTLPGRICDLSDQQTLLTFFSCVSISIKKYLLMSSHLDENDFYISFSIVLFDHFVLINKLIKNCNTIAKNNPPPSLIRSQFQLYTSLVILAYILDIGN